MGKRERALMPTADVLAAQAGLQRHQDDTDKRLAQLASDTGLSIGCIHQFLTNDEPRATRRTLRKVQAFLASVQPARKPRKRVAA